MSTSFLPDQMRPVKPKEKPIVRGSNVRHRTLEELADASGVVNRTNELPPGQRRIGVTWKVKGKLLPEQWHDEQELENTD